MSKRVAWALVAAIGLGSAPAARAADVTGSSLTIEGYGGWQNLNINAPVSSVANAAQGYGGTGLVGGDLLWKASLLGIGVAVDKTLGGDVRPWTANLLLGVVFDVMPSLRLEALGEAGRVSRSNDFGDLFTSTGTWELGLRPGVSFRLLPSPIRFGISGLVRWPTSGSDIGSPNYGIIGRVGFEMP